MAIHKGANLWLIVNDKAQAFECRLKQKQADAASNDRLRPDCHSDKKGAQHNDENRQNYREPAQD
jgi:hypothetical protein